MNLRDALHGYGITVGREEVLPGGGHRIQFAGKGRKGSVIVSSPKEAVDAIVTRYCQWLALDHGLSREQGAVVAEQCLADAYASEEPTP